MKNQTLKETGTGTEYNSLEWSISDPLPPLRLKFLIPLHGDWLIHKYLWRSNF